MRLGKNDLSIKRCDIFNTGGEDNDRQAGKPDSAMEQKRIKTDRDRK